MFTTRRFWIGIAFSAILLGLFFWQVDLGDTWDALKDANYLWLIPAIAVYFIAVFFRTLRWHFLLRPLKSVSPGRLYPVVIVGYMANNLLPVRLGELVRSYFLGEREGVSKTATLATIILERVYDGVGLIIIGLIVWPLLPVPDVLRDFSNDTGIPEALMVALVVLPFAVVLAVFVGIALSPRLGRAVVAFTLRLVPVRVRPPVEVLLHRFIEGLASLRSARRVATVLLLTFPVWLTEAAMYWIVMLGFDIGQPFHGILLTASASNLATSVPSTAGGVGPFEYATRLTLEGLGETAEAAAAYAIVLHVALLAPVTVAGLAIMWAQNLRLGDIAKRPGRMLEAQGAGQAEP